MCAQFGPFITKCTIFRAMLPHTLIHIYQFGCIIEVCLIIQPLDYIRPAPSCSCPAHIQSRTVGMIILLLIFYTCQVRCTVILFTGHQLGQCLVY